MYAGLLKSRIPAGHWSLPLFLGQRWSAFLAWSSCWKVRLDWLKRLPMCTFYFRRPPRVLFLGAGAYHLYPALRALLLCQDSDERWWKIRRALRIGVSGRVRAGLFGLCLLLFGDRHDLPSFGRINQVLRTQAAEPAAFPDLFCLQHRDRSTCYQCYFKFGAEVAARSSILILLLVWSCTVSLIMTTLNAASPKNCNAWTLRQLRRCIQPYLTGTNSLSLQDLGKITYYQIGKNYLCGYFILAKERT